MAVVRIIEWLFKEASMAPARGAAATDLGAAAMALGDIDRSGDDLSSDHGVDTEWCRTATTEAGAIKTKLIAWRYF